MIDLEAVASLAAVGTHGTVVAAAGARGFTASAVSQQIKKLERQAGVPLLERVGRHVVLTGAARRLVEAGSRVLGDLEQLEASLHHDAGVVTGHLRVAAFSTAMRGIVAPAARAVLDAHPGLDLTLLEREPWDAIHLVGTGQCDIALVHRWGDVPLVVPDHIESEVIGSDVADVIVPAGHRLAQRRWVTPVDLLDEAWIATGEGTICREWLQRMYVGTGQLPRLVHQSMEFESHLALVGAGLGVALIPRLGRAPLAADVVAVPVRRPVPTREISTLTRRSMRGSPGIDAVHAALRGQVVGPCREP